MQPWYRTFLQCNHGTGHCQGLLISSNPVFDPFIYNGVWASCLSVRIDRNTTLGCFCQHTLCTMTTISLDRFAAVHYHMRYVHMVSTTRVICTLVLIWLVMFLSLGICLWNIILYFFIASVFTVICLLLSSLRYIRIFQIVKQHKRQIQAQHRTIKTTLTYCDWRKAPWTVSYFTLF